MREFLMRLVAGRRPYWIADEVAGQFASMNGVLGAGAVVALVQSLQQSDVSRAEFKLDGWTVTVEKAAPEKNATEEDQ